MSNVKDTITNAQDQAGESLKDDAQNTISSTDKDALRDSALDDASGGSLVYSGGYSAAVKGTLGTASNPSASGG
jgi:hypothetical protein